MSYMLGIDLGTTNSAMAFLQSGGAEIVSNAEGSRTTPSIVAFNKKDGETLVGETARRQQAMNSERTFSSVKRQMGTDWKTSDIDGKQYSAEEIGARVLMKLKNDAEAYLGETVDSAVITVPAYFNDAERQSTKSAGEIAGLKVERIINEPTAAALAYGINKEEDQIILVYDLGGGTFDVSLLEIGDGMIEVRSTAGDNKLGGDDWDGVIADWIKEQVQEEYDVDVSQDITAWTRVLEAAEEAKQELSSTESTSIALAFLGVDKENQPFSIQYDLSRSEFEEKTRDLLERTREPVDKVLKDADVDASEVNQVILVGGSTRMSAVQGMIKDIVGKDPTRTVNPDEVVAMGACYQAGIAEGKVKDMVLIDVTSLTLGLNSQGGMMVPLIERGTAMPCRETKTFTTAEDGQTSVQVQVFQGEREVTSGNKMLGEFELTGIPPAPRGVPQIEVTFDIDVNGILNVTAKDTASGVKQEVKVTGSSGLDDAEVQQAVQDAEAHAEDDKLIREKISAKNRAQSLLNQNKRLLEDNKERVSEQVASELETAISELNTAVESDNHEEIKSKNDTLFEVSQKFGSELYK